MMGRADIQWRDDAKLAGCMRLALVDGFCSARHDNYEKACTVFAYYDGDVRLLEVLGWDRQITTQDRKDLEFCVMRAGFNQYIWERFEDGVLAHKRHCRWSIPLAKWVRVRLV